MDRKLAAILAADVVGYSTLMERDEQGTFERLRSGRKDLFEPEIARHHGRIFKLMGDGMLAEFSSVVDAVECAVGLQRGLAERNAALPEGERIRVRIGINLGDVIIEGKDRHGEGVIIAARLQQIADPGGICVSRAAYDQTKNKFIFEPMGEQKVKNIAEPIQAFRVKLDGVPVRRLAPDTAKRPVPWAAAIAAITALAAIGFAVLKPADAPTASATIPVIAVLPFDNMSGDPSLDYLGDGIAEDIITMLSRSPDLAVIARNSSFTFKGEPVDVRKIGKELVVGYVLEGSVRKDVDEMRIAAQLVNAGDGKHVWAERFDKSGPDPLALQDEVTAKIVATLAGEHGQVRLADYQRAWGKDTASLAEYDFYLRGHDYLMRDTKEDYAHGAAILKEGLARFPKSSLLKIKLGLFHFFNAFSYFSDNPEFDYRRAGELGREVLAAQSLTPQVARLAHWLMAYVLLQERDFAMAITEAEKAVALAPYDASLAGLLATVLIMSGRPDQGLEWTQRAVAGDAAAIAWWNYRLGLAYSVKGDDEKSIAALNEALQFPDTMLLTAVGHLRVGRREDAQAEYKRAMALDPTFTQAKWREGYFYSDPAIVEGQIADLARLGLPEQ